MLGERDQVNSVLSWATVPSKNIEQTLALGLLVLNKYNRSGNKFGNSPTADQIAKCAEFTPEELAVFTTQAALMLRQFAVDLALPVERRPSLADWWRDVWKGVVSIIVYSLCLLGFAGLWHVFGFDFVHALKWWAGNTGG